MKLSENFSSVYHDLLPELMQVEVPEEKWADCLNCHYCSNKTKDRYHTKCCDYHPSLPNYIIGAILSDGSEALNLAKAVIREKISNKIGVTQFGISPSLEYQKAFEQDRDKNIEKKTTEGQRLSLLCPFFNNGLCGIHKYRTDVCGSFFCLSVSGTEGKQLMEKVQSFTLGLDFKMSFYVAKKIKPGLKELPGTKLLRSTTTLIENSQGTIENNYENLWTEWKGQEEQYFKQCFQLINEMDADTTKDILGSFLHESTESIMHAATSAYQQLIPDKLFFHPDKYRQWLSSQALVVEPDSKELFFLRLFNGKIDTGKLLVMIEDFDGDFPEKLTMLLKHGILDEQKPQA